MTFKLWEFVYVSLPKMKDKRFFARNSATRCKHGTEEFAYTGTYRVPEKMVLEIHACRM